MQSYYVSSAGSYQEFNSLETSLLNNGYQSNEVRAIQLHLSNPSLPASTLSESTGNSLEDIRHLYSRLKKDHHYHKLTESIFYSRRMMHQFAALTLKDWTDEPAYVEKLLRGESVASRICEIHPTKGTCDYSCAMCLWSDKQELTYAKKKLDKTGLLGISDWERIFHELAGLGTKIMVFSGGGEVLLNSDLLRIVRLAHDMMMKVQIYTNGFNFDRFGSQGLEELVHIEQIRVSIHSPFEDTYNAIVGLPKEAGALQKVSQNIREIIRLRSLAGSDLKVGIGFVIQPLNYDQIESMASFAHLLGVDFFNIRKDEVSVTEGLSAAEISLVASQLNSVRNKLINGDYGSLRIDLSDDLTALANGFSQETPRTAHCLAKHFRPTISPFGIVAPCDLKAEPRFADSTYALGNASHHSLVEITKDAAGKEIKANCAQCMPSGRTGNAVYTKLLADHTQGIMFTEQPFCLD